MTRKEISRIVAFFIFFMAYSCENLAAWADFKNQTSTETFLESFNVDLPDAQLQCRASGSLSQIFRRSTKVKAGGNAFVVDQENREIGLFERILVEEPPNFNGIITGDVFVKVNDVKREELTDLLLNKKLTAFSSGVQIVFVLRFITDESTQTFIYDGKDEDGNPLDVTIFTKLKKLSTIIVDGQKFFTGDGTVKIRFPEPPKKIDPDGTFVNFFRNTPGNLVCSCIGCPVHDFDLTDLKNAFDQELVDDITNEAIQEN